jgi:hypothetical protein
MLSALDVIGLITGILTLVSTLRAVVHRFLPSRRIKDLEESLKATEIILQSADQEGIILDVEFVNKSREKLFS